MTNNCLHLSIVDIPEVAYERWSYSCGDRMGLCCKGPQVPHQLSSPNRAKAGATRDTLTSVSCEEDRWTQNMCLSIDCGLSDGSKLKGNFCCWLSSMVGNKMEQKLSFSEGLKQKSLMFGNSRMTAFLVSLYKPI